MMTIFLLQLSAKEFEMLYEVGLIIIKFSTTYDVQCIGNKQAKAIKLKYPLANTYLVFLEFTNTQINFQSYSINLNTSQYFIYPKIAQYYYIKLTYNYFR